MVRAAKALRVATGCTQGAHMSIEKSIPSEAGMGGGSSDAAATLLALNRLWQLRLPLSSLLQIGLQLGADVPFFLQGRNAWVEGVGEKITPICVPPARFLVAKPPAGLETARIFKVAGLKTDTETATLTGFAENPFDFGQNDLQTVAQGLCPGVTVGLNWLLGQGANKGFGLGSGQELKGRMTGSGSAVFAHLDATRESETGLVFGAAPAGFVVRICENLQVHPLLGWAD